MRSIQQIADVEVQPVNIIELGADDLWPPYATVMAYNVCTPVRNVYRNTRGNVYNIREGMPPRKLRTHVLVTNVALRRLNIIFELSPLIEEPVRRVVTLLRVVWASRITFYT